MSTLFLHTMLLICFVAAYANRDSQKRLYCRASRTTHCKDKYQLKQGGNKLLWIKLPEVVDFFPDSDIL
jgi:hypothetical protein